MIRRSFNDREAQIIKGVSNFFFNLLFYLQDLNAISYLKVKNQTTLPYLKRFKVDELMHV